MRVSHTLLVLAATIVNSTGLVTQGCEHQPEPVEFTAFCVPLCEAGLNDRTSGDGVGYSAHDTSLAQQMGVRIERLPGDVFPRWMAGSVVGLGGLAGAIGGMLMAKFAGTILETVGSYGPIFAVASCAYLVALLTIHLIIPRYQVVATGGTAGQGA